MEGTETATYLLSLYFPIKFVVKEKAVLTPEKKRIIL